LPVLKSNSIKAYDNMYQAEAASIQTKEVAMIVVNYMLVYIKHRKP
jgi:hypothetical protein